MKRIWQLIWVICLIFSTMPACKNSSVNFPALSNIQQSDAKAITAFALYTDENAPSPVAIGTIDESAKTIAAMVPVGTNLAQLVAAFVTTGNSIAVGGVVQVSGIKARDFSSPVVYTVTAGDKTTAAYTVTVRLTNTSSKAITDFALFTSSPVSPSNLLAIGTIDEPSKTINVIVSSGTVTAVAGFTITGVSAKVNGLLQTSGVDVHDFTSPVIYTIADANGATVDYTVTVTVAPPNAAAITMFSLLGITGTIDESVSPKTISVSVPFATDVTHMAAAFTTTGASVKVGTTVQVNGSTTNNFTNPVDYSVTSVDGLTVTPYTVTVTKALNTEKAITAFSIRNYPLSFGFINESAKTIFVYMPRFTDLRTLIANFSTTNAAVTIGTLNQYSGFTPNDFLYSITAPLSYVVHAADGSTATYAVTVTYSYTNIPKTGQIIPFYAGDDGQLQKGAAWPNPRFTAVLSQSTTTVAWHDNLTGLIWPEDAGGSVAAVKKTWQEALDYVANLNANNYLGFNDWRLPNVNEIESLVANRFPFPPAAWLSTPPQPFKNIAASVGGPSYWTSTTLAVDPTKAFSVNLYDNTAFGVIKTWPYYYAWPVRYGPGFYLFAPAKVQVTGQTVKYATGDDGDLHAGVTTFANPRFTAFSRGTGTVIADNMTGLVWSGDAGTPTSGPCSGGTKKGWGAALDHVLCLNTKNYLGFSDWRLPNSKELRSLINYDKSDLVTFFQTWGFSNVKADAYWTSSIVSDGHSGLISLNTGDQLWDILDGTHWVWPVRGGE